MKRLSLSLILVVAGLFAASESNACAMCGCGSGPFGSYSRVVDWGWYGERYKVQTPQDAKRIVLQYYSGEDVKTGEVSERKYYFEVDIHDARGKLVDVVIVDKRTGRIRSTY